MKQEILAEPLTTIIAIVGLLVTVAQFTDAARARKTADFWGEQLEKIRSDKSSRDDAISSHHQKALSLVYAYERVPGWKYASLIGALCFLAVWLFGISVFFKSFMLKPETLEFPLAIFGAIYALGGAYGFFAATKKLLTLQVHRAQTINEFMRHKTYEPSLVDVKHHPTARKYLTLLTAGITLTSFAAACFSVFPVQTPNSDAIITTGFLVGLIAFTMVLWPTLKMIPIYKDPFGPKPSVVTLRND